jgi:hypothetical protein
MRHTDTTERPYRRYRGVAIYRIKDLIIGSDIRELKNGDFQWCKPQYDIYFAFCGGYWEDSLKEVKESIDKLISDAIIHGCTEQSMVDELNED